MSDFRAGLFDVLVGVNLLREGLDLPEVSLVAIIDADKEGFLRSHRSLTQTAGRAARNVNGKVIMYADTITESMNRTIDETNRRRSIQMKYNEQHHITPQQIVKDIKGGVLGRKPSQNAGYDHTYVEPDHDRMVADPIMKTMTMEQIKASIERSTRLMNEAAKNLEFLQAAQFRDEILRLKELLEVDK